MRSGHSHVNIYVLEVSLNILTSHKTTALMFTFAVASKMKFIYFAKSCWLPLSVFYAAVSATLHANPAVDSVKTSLFAAGSFSSSCHITPFLIARHQAAPKAGRCLCLKSAGLELARRGKRAQGRFVWFLSWWGYRAYRRYYSFGWLYLTRPSQFFRSHAWFVGEDLLSSAFPSWQSWRLCISYTFLVPQHSSPALIHSRGRYNVLCTAQRLALAGTKGPCPWGGVGWAAGAGPLRPGPLGFLQQQRLTAALFICSAITCMSFQNLWDQGSSERSQFTGQVRG